MNKTIGLGECELCSRNRLCVGTLIGWLCKECCELYCSHLEDCIDDLNEYQEEKTNNG